MGRGDSPERFPVCSSSFPWTLVMPRARPPVGSSVGGWCVLPTQRPWPRKRASQAGRPIASALPCRRPPVGRGATMLLAARFKCTTD
ncbi:hypothetical protein B296_00046029, partial [Ensete ventricosum]